MYNLFAAKDGEEEVELRLYDCINEDKNKSLISTNTSFCQRHKCLIISIIIFLVISAIAATLAVIMVPRTSGFTSGPTSGLNSGPASGMS